MFVKLFSVSDCFDFNESIFWQFSNFKSSASWAFFGEEGAVNFVHSSEIADVLQQNGGFNNVFHGQTLGFQNSLNVFQRLFGLAFDAWTSEGTGSWVDWQLTGNEYEVTSFYSLGVWADCAWSFFSSDDVFHRIHVPLH